MSEVGKDAIRKVLAFEWSEKEPGFNFWMTLGTVLYPEVLLSILSSTEMCKLNLSSPSFSEYQKKDWATLL